METEAKRHVYSIREQACVRVVVFTDRAEVQRRIKAKLSKGENELVVNSISNAIDKDSVRVEGKGNASVLDVVCQDKRVEADNLDNISSKEKELKAEIGELETKRDLTSYKLDRINKEISVLNEYANSLSKKNDSDNKSSSSSHKESVVDFLEFLSIYSEKLELLDAQKYSIEKELKKLKEQIDVARENLVRLSSSTYKETIEITILVESAKDDADVELFVSYVVNQAQWVPKYDIRTFSKDKSMIINYFGVITQNTGEDWNDTRLSLSTAMPSVGGQVPVLTTQNVVVKQRNLYKKRNKTFSGFGFGGTMSAPMKKEMSHYDDDLQELNLEISHLSTQVNQPASIGSTATYEIPRAATIPSDNNTHKVTIGIINLKPEFEYESVPRRVAYAFIKAKVINTSEYSLLAGTANVFLDNNFVAKTELKSYSPQEEFFCSLGIDPAIKIDYKPLKKFKAQTGILGKSKTLTTYVQTIEVKNTTPNVAKILLSDNLPLSNDDKINVKLLEPNLKSQTNVKLNKSNNLEFNLMIGANKSEEIIIKYSIEHSESKEIEFI